MSKVTAEMLDVFTKGCWGPGAYSTGEYKSGFQALFDAKLISLPDDEAAIRESVVRECIGRLPSYTQCQPELGFITASNKMLERCHEALQSLLPTKDRAKELADEWAETYGTSPEEKAAGLDAIRWLIEREGV